MTNKQNIGLKDYINSTVEQIMGALPKGIMLKGDIEFNLSVVSTWSAEGGLDLKVLQAGGHKKNQEVQNVKFSVGQSPTYSVA